MHECTENSIHISGIQPFCISGILKPRSSGLRNPIHISAQENLKLLSAIAIVQLLAEPLECTGATLVFRGPPVKKH